MRTGLNGWIVVMVLLGTTAYAISEEITLTTYYPSPRGVYNELRTAGNVQFGTLEPFDPPESAPRLYVVQDSLTAPAVRVQARIGAEPATVFTIDHDGNVGVGPADPDARIRLDVQGGLRVGSIAAANAPAGTIQWTGTRFQGSFGSPAQETWRDFATVQPGVQMAYVTAPPNTNNPPCPAGSGAPAMRKWLSTSCADVTDCSTSAGWSAPAPTCSYLYHGACYLDKDSISTCDPPTPAECVANQWTEAICMGN